MKRFQLSTYEQYTAGLLLVSCVVMAGIILDDFVGYRTVSLLLLMSVSLCALFFDILPLLVMAILSALLWDFFFIPPRFTFQVSSTEDALMLLMYFLIAMVHAVLTYKIRQVEKEVVEKDEKAQMLKLYNALLNSLSHELRTPISTIIGATDNLKNSPEKLSDNAKAELLEDTQLAALRLNRQVENLLNMSRLESEVIKPKKDWVDVNELIYSTINVLEDNLKRHKIEVRMEEGLPLFKIDFGLMEQVLYNLIYNATVYTPAGSRILVDASVNDDKLVLIVEDNGPGFPTDEVGFVFDKFYRLKNAPTGGTGLGLSIAKGFVEAHGGTIAVENNVPHGAMFTIIIPAETSYLNNLKNE